jgi:hypothetical protein
MPYHYNFYPSFCQTNAREKLIRTHKESITCHEETVFHKPSLDFSRFFNSTYQLFSFLIYDTLGIALQGILKNKAFLNTWKQ